MNQRLYLLDTDVSINYLRGSIEVTRKIAEVGLANFLLSEITVAELKYGAAKSNRPDANMRQAETFIGEFGIVVIFQPFGAFCGEEIGLGKTFGAEDNVCR